MVVKITTDVNRTRRADESSAPHSARVSPSVLLSIRVQLRQKPDEKGRAVLDWSSVSGTRQRVSNGTLCSAAVVVERRPLITLAVPWITHLFGLD